MNEDFNKAVSAEGARMMAKGYDADHDDLHGIQHLLNEAYNYAARGLTAKVGVLISAAGAWVHRNLEGGKNSMQKDIEKFMLACDQEVKKYPEVPSEEVKQLRIKLMTEELLGSKSISDEIKIYPDVHAPNPHGLIPSKSDELIQSMLNDDLVGIADGIGDVLYVVIGTAAAYGINIQEIFDEIQRSNMTKAVWDEETQTYKVIKNEYGKIMKPESYSPPVIEPIILKQIGDSNE